MFNSIPNKPALCSAICAGYFLVSGALAPVEAATTSVMQDKASCVTALDERGLADTGRYDVRIHKIRGGMSRQLRLILTPQDQINPKMKAECRLASGIVKDVRILERSVLISSK